MDEEEKRKTEEEEKRKKLIYYYLKRNTIKNQEIFGEQPKKWKKRKEIAF